MKPPWLTETIVARLRATYRFAMESFAGKGSSVLWAHIASKQADIHSALMADDDSLEPLLADPGSTYLYYGVDNIYPRFREVDPNSPVHEGLGKDAHVRLGLLAEAIGAVRCWNPQGGALFPPPNPEKPDLSAEDLLSEIENILGIDLDFPSPFEGEIGLSTSRGLVTNRAANAIYQAYRLKQTTMPNGRFMEIGGGVGRTAYYAKKLGLNDYTLVDLPMTLVAQALFLIATLGPDSVWLAGEPLSEQEGRIRLVPPTFIFETMESFDIILNVDSFTEMDRDHAKAYIDFAKSQVIAILSINHESNRFMVRELVSDMSVLRFPYWLRPGYVEELYWNTGTLLPPSREN